MPYLRGHTSYTYSNLNAPIGTKMVFNQTTAPLGWTKETTDDVALRLTSGTVGTGGTVAFETAFASVTPTATSGAIAATTIAVATGPVYSATHKPGNSGAQTIYASGTTFGVCTNKFGISTFNGGVQNGAGGSCGVYNSIQTNGGGGSHTHTFTQPSISAVNLDVSYVDVIIATKS